MSALIPPLRIALAQIDSSVGDLEGNAAKIAERIAAARDAGAELVLFPELALTGYPPEDLLLKEHFLQAATEAVGELAREAEGIVALVGFPERADDVHNALAVLAEGELQAVYRKSVLPNYGVFDEQRYFQFGESGAVLQLGDARLGLTICEDIWTPGPPASDEALAGAALILNASASPYHARKGLERERMLIQRARDNLSAVAFCNMVGGQDELVFDGHSLLLDHEGCVLARAPQFQEALVVGTVDLQAALTARLRDTRLRPPVRRALPEVRRLGPLARREHVTAAPVGGEVTPLLEPEAEVYEALVLGTRDYVEKNGFRHVVIGLSGGIDSTLTAAGRGRRARHRPGDGGDDAVALLLVGHARRRQGAGREPRRRAAGDPDREGDGGLRRAAGGVLRRPRARHHRGEPPGAHPRQPADGALEQVRLARAHDRQQVRELGRLLDAVRRLGGRLRGDQGRAQDARLPARPSGATRRTGAAPVPRSIIDRPPSAELRDDQKDSDSLGDYDTLDAILEAYVEEDHDPEQLERAGLPADAIERVVALVDRAEYKRRQAPPGIKITPRAFGRDRRMPITNAYRPRRSELRRGERWPGGPGSLAGVRPRAKPAARRGRRRSSARGRTGGPRRR